MSYHDGQWLAMERDEDLVVLCTWCHRYLHAMWDRDPGWSLLDRREATQRSISTIRRSLLVAATKVTGGML
ncbi:hypothetical protein [Devriesea agamarum]|uniref:hypothetical protein n=1 Tax=Devriesea agamarum TaxID=472569 RepID=UPI00071D101A|nr:hypothetical protein [Devriesea agamarum]